VKKGLQRVGWMGKSKTNAVKKGFVSIIIPQWNGKELLGQTLNAISKNTLYRNYEVIVVDNNSTDGSVEMLKEAKKKGLVHKLILNERNMGFAFANNQGFEASDAEYCFMLSNDTIPQKGWLSDAVQIAESDPRIGSVGIQTTTPYGFEHGKYAVKAVVRERLSVCGAAMLMRKEAIDLVGPLDAENFSPVYGEETDWNFRAHNAGFRVLESCRSIVIHVGSPSAKKRGGNKWQYTLMNERRLMAMLCNLSLPDFLRFVPGLALIFLNSIRHLQLHWLLQSYWNNLKMLPRTMELRKKKRAVSRAARQEWEKRHRN